MSDPGSMERDGDGVTLNCHRRPAHPIDHHPVSGRVLVWDPPRLFAHEWHNPPLADSVVHYELAHPTNWHPTARRPS